MDANNTNTFTQVVQAIGGVGLIILLLLILGVATAEPIDKAKRRMRHHRRP